MFKEKKLKKSAFTYAGFHELKIVAKKEVEKLTKKTFWQKIFRWTAPKPELKLKDFKIYAGPLKSTDQKIADLYPEMDPGALPDEYRKIVEDQWMPTPQLTVYDHTEKKTINCCRGRRKTPC